MSLDRHTKYRFSFWTGPTQVYHYLDRLAGPFGFGFDITAGTEHVYGYAFVDNEEKEP